MDSFDLARMLFGDLSFGYAFEIVLRTTILYAYTLFIIRMMGRRATQNMTPFEFLIVIALGAAVGDPMLYPDVPVVAGMLVITIVLGLEHLLAFAVQRLPVLNRFVLGKPRLLILDGRLNHSALRQETLSAEELYAELRNAGVEQLGEVKCAYLEEGGRVSILRYSTDKVRPGLPIVPPWDLRLPPMYHRPALVAQSGVYVCCNCGQRLEYRQQEPLLHCPTCANET